MTYPNKILIVDYIYVEYIELVIYQNVYICNSIFNSFYILLSTLVFKSYLNKMNVYSLCRTCLFDRIEFKEKFA